MNCLILMFGGRGMLAEACKDGSGSGHGVYQAYTNTTALLVI
jgi:hypothetical protein